MKISFFGGMSKSRYVDVTNQMCANLFLETAAGGQAGAIYGTPGLDVVRNFSASPFRGMIPVNEYLWGVAGEKVFRTDVSGTDYKIVGVVPFATTPVSMACNGLEVAIAVGTSSLYVVNLATLALSTVSLPVHCGRICHLDGYIVAVGRGTRLFCISDNLDATTWDALDYASCEGSADELLSVAVAHRQLWFFKRYATEVWYNSGATFPIVRVDGVYVERGIAAVQSPSVIDNTVYWLADDRTVRRASDYAPEIKSTREIESLLAGLDVVDDAIGSSFGIQGHSFYQIKFPTAGLTLAYDISNDSWLKRTSGSTERNWTGNCVATIAGKTMVGDEFGNLCEQSMECYTDSGMGGNVREGSTLHITNEGKELAYQRFAVEVARPTASDPDVMLALSDDGGKSWDECEMRTAPPYEWVALGSARKRQFRLRISDSYPTAISEAYFDAEAWNR